MFVFAIFLALVLSLISSGINYSLRNIKFFGSYKGFFLLLTVFFFLSVSIIPYAKNCYSILYGIIYAWIVILGIKVKKLFTKKEASFKAFSKWFGYGMIILSLLMVTGIRISMIVYGVLWLLLFVYGGDNKVIELLSKLNNKRTHKTTNMEVKGENLQQNFVLENTKKDNPNIKSTVQSKENDKPFNNKENLWTLFAILIIVAFGVIGIIADRNNTPTESGQYVYWILTVVVAITSAVLLISKGVKYSTHIGIVLSVLALAFLALGINYSYQLNKANEAFESAQRNFNTSYDIMKTGKNVEETSDAIRDNPLVQDAIDDGYIDADAYDYDDEESDKIDRGMFRELKKNLNTMKKNNTGKYDYQHYKDKYDDLKDDYYELFY